MEVFGQTRSRITPNYALITPDTHVNSWHIDWDETAVVIHISPEMGARFTQYTATMSAGGGSGLPGETVERFFYVQEGDVTLEIFVTRGADKPEETHQLKAGSYAFLPAVMGHKIRCKDSAKLVVFEKPYQPQSDWGFPKHVVGHESESPGEPFMGDEDARLQTLLPIEGAYDMAVNIFTYQPGATLPQVEIHVMEHGLLMLGGQGVYRLGEDYFPVAGGDVIWMASYCPQWFVAMGKQPASYIYYKDIHRDRIVDKIDAPASPAHPDAFRNP